jgi:hypothetical protein
MPTGASQPEGDGVMEEAVEATGGDQHGAVSQRRATLIAGR